MKNCLRFSTSMLLVGLACLSACSDNSTESATYQLTASEIPSTGISVAFKSLANGKYVAAESGGQLPLIANRDAVNGWETFDLQYAGENSFSIRARANGLFVTLDSRGQLIARDESPSSLDRFQFIDVGQGYVALRSAVTQKFVSAESGGQAPLIANRDAALGWEQFTLLQIGQTAPPPPSPTSGRLQVLLVGMNGCNNNEYTDAGGFRTQMSARVKADVDEYLVAGGITDDPSHFFKNPDYFRKKNGTGAPFEYDVIVYTGANGCSYNAIEDVDAMVKAHNGTSGAKPAMFLRSSHYFAKGWNEKYRELLGIGSRDHDVGQAGTTYTFPNASNPVISGINTSTRHFGDDNSSSDDAGGMSLYYNDGGFYGLNLSVLVQASKVNNFSYSAPGWGSIGPHSQAIAWTYEYSNNLSGGTGVHPRMFAHTYYSKAGNLDGEMADIVARALVWTAGKDAATYLK
jgi:hypothetical protein